MPVPAAPMLAVVAESEPNDDSPPASPAPNEPIDVPANSEAPAETSPAVPPKALLMPLVASDVPRLP